MLRAGEEKGNTSSLEIWVSRICPHGSGSHQVSWRHVTGWISQDRSSTASSLPGKNPVRQSILV